jgi:DNA-binding transcriptional MerR regulator
MNSSSNLQLSEDLDVEWTDLILKARTLGMTIEEIRFFLVEPSAQEALENNKFTEYASSQANSAKLLFSRLSP